MGASIWAPGTAETVTGAVKEESFTATAGQTLFSLGSIVYELGVGAITVYVAGVRQRSAIDYTETSSTSFTLAEGVDEGTIVTAEVQTEVTGSVTVISANPATIGANKYVHVNGGGTDFEGLTAAQVLSDIGAEPADATILKDADIGVSVQAYDADTLKADQSATLAVGYVVTPHDAGTKTTGTFTPDPAQGNLQKYINGGAHTLAPPGSSCSLVIQITNNASAGAITTSGFTKVTGTSPTTTNGDDFMAYIVQVGSFSHLNWQALQ